MYSVLIVEDQEQVRKLLRSQIENKAKDLGGFEIEEATNGIEARKKLADPTKNFEIVISDKEMPRHLPERGGLELLKWVRETPKTQAIKFILLSGEDLEPEEKEFVAKLKAHFFKKPHRLPDLFAAMFDFRS